MIPLVGLALFSASLRAEEDSAPEQNPLYIKGINALKDHLPDLAIEPLKALWATSRTTRKPLPEFTLNWQKRLYALAACRNTSATLRSLPPPLLIIWPNT